VIVIIFLRNFRNPDIHVVNYRSLLMMNLGEDVPSFYFIVNSNRYLTTSTAGLQKRWQNFGTIEQKTCPRRHLPPPHHQRCTISLPPPRQYCPAWPTLMKLQSTQKYNKKTDAIRQAFLRQALYKAWSSFQVLKQSTKSLSNGNKML